MPATAWSWTWTRSLSPTVPRATCNLLGLFDVDNTVLVPDPVYPVYVDDNVTDGRKIIYMSASAENGFLADAG